MPSICQTVLDTALARLAVLFVATAAGNPAIAKEAARRTLAAYNVWTEEELCLAAQIISLRFHILEVLAQAVGPESAPNRTLHLRGSAVSLSREAHKAQRKLDQLQSARRLETRPQQEPVEEIAAPQTEGSPEIGQEVARTHGEAEHLAKKLKARDGGRRWSKAYHKRELAKRMAEQVKLNQANYAASLIAKASHPDAAPAVPSDQAGHQTNLTPAASTVTLRASSSGISYP
jgi:hypothetical protein